MTLKGHKGKVWCVAMTPDGKELASGTWGSDAEEESEIILWDVSTGKPRSFIKGHPPSGVHSLAFSSDGKLLASADGEGFVKLWDGASGRLKKTLPSKVGLPHSVKFTADGKILAAAGDSYDKKKKKWIGKVILWDVANEKELGLFKGDNGAVVSVAFTPDGKTLAWGCGEEVRLWDVASQKEQNVFKGHTKTVTALAFAADGKALASSSEEKIVKIWDVATGKEKAALKMGDGFYGSPMTLTPDGKTLAIGNFDGTIELRDVASGKVGTTLKGHTHWVMSLAFTADAKTLVSGSQDYTVKIWDLEDGKKGEK